MQTLAGGLCPTGKATDTVIDFLLSKVDDLHFSAGISHPFD
jgi:hypothetical protein